MLQMNPPLIALRLRIELYFTYTLRMPVVSDVMPAQSVYSKLAGTNYTNLETSVRIRRPFLVAFIEKNGFCTN